MGRGEASAGARVAALRRPPPLPASPRWGEEIHSQAQAGEGVGRCWHVCHAHAWTIFSAGRRSRSRATSTLPTRLGSAFVEELRVLVALEDLARRFEARLGLQCNTVSRIPGELRVAPLPHLTHSAGAYRRAEFVRTEADSGNKRHTRSQSVQRIYTTARLCWWAPAEATLTTRPVSPTTIAGNITDTSEFRG